VAEFSAAEDLLLDRSKERDACVS